MAVKIDGSAESHTEAKMNLNCMMYGYAKGCHRGKWLACNGLMAMQMDGYQSEGHCEATGMSPREECMAQTEQVSVQTLIRDCKLNESTVRDKSIIRRLNRQSREECTGRLSSNSAQLNRAFYFHAR